MTTQPTGESRFAVSQDGLRLHYKIYGREGLRLLPAVCLPGLARTTADFDRLADALSSLGRQVITLDYRGRGLSDRDPDPKNYALPVEAADGLTVLADAAVDRAVFIGTSRGGLITMILAGHRPDMVRGAVLNDIGPVLEPQGLQRIRGYVGKLPQPRSWEDAVAGLRHVAGAQFTAMSDAEWLAYAQTTFEDDKGTFRLRYDPALSNALSELDLTSLPTLWDQFDALRAVPLLVIRGANSDLLSTETAAAMLSAHADARLLNVPDQGHAPFLNDDATLAQITRFLAHCDAGQPPA